MPMRTTPPISSASSSSASAAKAFGGMRGGLALDFALSGKSTPLEDDDVDVLVT